MNKLGAYITINFAGVENWDLGVAVTMNLSPGFVGGLKQRGAFVVGRYYTEAQPLELQKQRFFSQREYAKLPRYGRPVKYELSNPEQRADEYFEQMKPYVLALKGSVDCWMGYNEPAVWNPADCEKLRRFTFRWSSRMHNIGAKTAAYSFSEGHPDLSLLPYLVNHGCDYYIRHEYDAPEMWRTQGWRCLRYRKERVYFPQPFIIGECGIDGGVAGIDKPQRGWKEFGSVDRYIESLRWYRAELEKDPYVIGAAIFAGSWNVGDGSFNIENEEKIRLLLKEGGVITPSIDVERLKRIARQQFPRDSLDAIGAVALFRAYRFSRENVILGAAIALAESGCKPYTINTKNVNGTYDRGWMQLNSRYHKSDECAFNPACATETVSQIIKDWRGWGAFSAYNAGTHVQYIETAKSALLQLETLEADAKKNFGITYLAHADEKRI